jgi:hypothetical protein
MCIYHFHSMWILIFSKSHYKGSFRYSKFIILSANILDKTNIIFDSSFNKSGCLEIDWHNLFRSYQTTLERVMFRMYAETVWSFSILPYTCTHQLI